MLTYSIIIFGLRAPYQCQSGLHGDNPWWERSLLFPSGHGGPSSFLQSISITFIADLIRRKPYICKLSSIKSTYGIPVTNYTILIC